MRTVSFTLLIVLPFCLANILPVGPFAQGNKRRTPAKIIRTYANHGNCQNLISNWQDWSGGAQFSIEVKNGGSSAIDSWKAEIKFTKKVDSLGTYDGTAKEINKKELRSLPLHTTVKLRLELQESLPFI